MTDKSPQISQDEFEFYLNNHLRLAEVEKTLATTSGEITGALDSQQAVSSPVHYSTMKSLLDDNWLFNILRGLKNKLQSGDGSSPRLLRLKSLVVDTMQFIETSYPNRESRYNVLSAGKLRERLIIISNAIGDIRSLAETRLISLIEENDK